MPACHKKLTPAQEAFAQHYALNSNGAEAYRHAYPSSKAKPQHQAVEAQRLIGNPKVARRIAELQQKIIVIAEKKFEVTVERVLEELATIAFQNSDDYFEWGTFERPIYRKNRETKQLEPVIGPDGEHMTETVPYARAKPSDQLTRKQKAAIISASETISRTGDRVLEIKMADKLGALTKIGQHLKMFTERHEHAGPNGRPIQVQHATLPDLSKVEDPREALKEFEQFRTSMHAAGNA